MMTLDEATRHTAVITDMEFAQEDMSDYRLHEVQFHRCRFNDCNFDLSNISDSRFTGCRFTDCNFQETTFTACAFHEPESKLGSQWIRCNLSEAKFIKCDIGRNTFSKGTAFRLALTDCDAIQLTFESAVHRKVSRSVLKGSLVFSKCRMQFSTFAPGDYEGSAFHGCDLRECDLSGSHLIRVSFLGSNLNNADLTGSILDGATLAHCSIEAFDLSSVRSFDSMIVSRDQHEQLLGCLGIRTLN
jgi:fluoroquinolone resistance protein